MTGVQERLVAVEQRQREQADVLAALEDVSGTVKSLSEQLADVQVALKLTNDAKQKMPRPTVRFWRDLGAEEAKAEIAKLKGWYMQIAVPWLGAMKLPDCVWQTDGHGALLTVLDVGSELWGALFLPERRSPAIVAAQAEFLGRVWPSLYEVVARSSRDCPHTYPQIGRAS
jgi:hypothetical protein